MPAACQTGQGVPRGDSPRATQARETHQRCQESPDTQAASIVNVDGKTWAILLLVLGAALALVGPTIAVVRAIANYRRNWQSAGTWDWLDVQLNQENVRSRMRNEAKWRAVELATVGVGVAMTATASLILIP